MEPPIRYQSQEGLIDALVGFANMARVKGLNVGVEECLVGLAAAQLGTIKEKSSFRYALKAIFCCSPEDGELFDEIFDEYWGMEKVGFTSRMTYFNQSNMQRDPKGSVVMMGQGQTEEAERENKEITGANAVERLVKTDFSQVAQVDHAYLEALAWKLWKQMSLRLKRRQKRSIRKGRLDLRQTIRKSLASGGLPLQLQFKDRIQQKQRLVILLDVSGSMDKYSFFLLRFICALKAHFSQIEAFLFSTKLIRISEMLEPKLLDRTLVQLSKEANNWSSGTRIGDCFKEFNRSYAKRVLNGRSTVLILSDGLETGDPGELAKETSKIRLRTRQLIWLNPLKGMAGYEPIARGMKAAMPSIDVFRSAHNLQSILELENLLIHV
ncbi:MAG: VWA domain-containing protein [Bacteroidota bacterium]